MTDWVIPFEPWTRQLKVTKRQSRLDFVTYVTTSITFSIIYEFNVKSSWREFLLHSSVEYRPYDIDHMIWIFLSVRTVCSTSLGSFQHAGWPSLGLKSLIWELQAVLIATDYWEVIKFLSISIPFQINNLLLGVLVNVRSSRIFLRTLTFWLFKLVY